MTKIEELKIKAFDIRNEIDVLELRKQKLIQEYNKILQQISKEPADAKTK